MRRPLSPVAIKLKREKAVYKKWASRCRCAGCVETGTPSNPWTAPHIPLTVLGELIEDWKKDNGNSGRYDVNVASQSAWGTHNHFQVGTKKILSELTGIPVRRMWAMEIGVDLHGRTRFPTKVISFHIADKLVCGMGLCPVETWNYGRLAKYYGPIALSGAERQMEKRAA